ncbi:MAG: pyruvate, phosphate dikinase, partial [Chloroflexi bacterium]|nr:pyruvate, phosphate dikinase [Chloroflexota bacterium]
QTRNGKRTADAAVNVAVDMANEGLITKQEAVMRIEPKQVEQLLHRRIDPNARLTVIAQGLNASPGAGSGMAAFDPDTAEKWAHEGKKVILVRLETSPDDVHGMISAQGILTARGGATSHAAVVARGLGKPCVSGCEVLLIDEDKREFTVAGTDYRVQEGNLMSINGSTGEVILGEVPMIEGDLSPKLKTLLGWADEIRDLGTWTNADYPRDARRARDFGAEGIGLCRTEHMFFEPERLPVVQKMILAKTDEDREAYLAQLLPFQRSDFEGIFQAMDGCPVIIRLIDPPLHEFLPKHEDLLVEVTELRIKGNNPALLKEKEELLGAVELMRESNPMLGLRGIRLGITMPGITRMQVRAIFEAACNCAQEGVVVKPEIMIPLTGHVNELKVARGLLEPVAQAVMEEKGITVDYKFGTMIEIPRAALTADQVAEYAEFFSYGTNDLTQTTFGYSRDDAEGKFLLKYVEMGILPMNPFQTLDRDGVGKLVRMGVELGRKTRPNLEVGICGEHGGDPNSIEFCQMAGLNYVSCSPFRVPVARLAAAQAAIRYPRS